MRSPLSTSPCPRSAPRRAPPPRRQNHVFEYRRFASDVAVAPTDSNLGTHGPSPPSPPCCFSRNPPSPVQASPSGGPGTVAKGVGWFRSSLFVLAFVVVVREKEGRADPAGPMARLQDHRCRGSRPKTPSTRPRIVQFPVEHSLSDRNQRIVTIPGPGSRRKLDSAPLFLSMPRKFRDGPNSEQARPGRSALKRKGSNRSRRSTPSSAMRPRVLFGFAHCLD